jgi:hypothetical protein
MLVKRRKLFFRDSFSLISCLRKNISIGTEKAPALKDEKKSFKKTPYHNYLLLKKEENGGYI